MESKYVLYPEGFMSTLLPLHRLKPMRIDPLYGESSHPVIEIQLPKSEINPEQVQLLDSGLEPVPLLKQTSALEDDIPKVKFHLEGIPPENLSIYYFDLNPGLELETTYEARLLKSTNPNLTWMSSLTCMINIRNTTDKRIGPGTFNVMVQQTKQSLYKAMARQMAQRRSYKREETMERKIAGPESAVAMAAPRMRARPKMQQVDTSRVAEGYLIKLPGINQFEKRSSTRLTLFRLQKIPVLKIHSCVLQEGHQHDYADLTLKFQVNEDASFPAGTLNLFSQSMQLLGVHHIQSINPHAEIRLKGSKDKRVDYKASLISQVLQVDKDGNRVIAYSGGITVRNEYSDRFPLLMSVYVPIEKPAVRMRNARGIQHWMYQPQHSRVKLLLQPIEKTLSVEFTLIAADPIMVRNPNQYEVMIQRAEKA